MGRELVSATVWQIGEGGMFVELPTPARWAGAVTIHFDLPGAGSQRVVAEPVWTVNRATRFAPRALHGGVGMSFRQIAAATKAKIAQYVNKQKSTYQSLQFALSLEPPAPGLPWLMREAGLGTFRDRHELKTYVEQVIDQLQ
jgi:hypothetical protein